MQNFRSVTICLLVLLLTVSRLHEASVSAYFSLHVYRYVSMRFIVHQLHPKKQGSCTLMLLSRYLHSNHGSLSR